MHLVLGRAGTGKSELCFRAIVEAAKSDPLGSPLYWVVPRQSTFSVQRRVVCDSGLDGVSRVRVVSFESLGSELLAEVGGVAIPEVSRAGRQMILGHLLRQLQPELTFFGSSARQAGLSVELDDALSELERVGKSPEDLERAVEEIAADQTQSGAQSLLPKLRDLRLIYSRYLQYLGQERLDPHRRLMQVLECVRQSAQVAQSSFFIDDFYDFTEYERRLIAAIASTGASVTVTLLADPSQISGSAGSIAVSPLSLFHRTARAHRALLKSLSDAGTAVGSTTRLSCPFRFRTPVHEKLERELVQPPATHDIPQQAEPVVGLQLIEASDIESELHACAMQIRSFVARGMRHRDICVLARSIDVYDHLMTSIFGEHGIPFFVDRRRDASHHPLVRLVRAVIQLPLHDWPHDAMMTIVKSGLCGLSDADADFLENFVVENRVRGSRWIDLADWAYPGEMGDEENEGQSGVSWELDRVNKLRRQVVAPLKPLVAVMQTGKPVRVRDVAAALVNTLVAMNVPRTLVEWMKQADSTGRIEERLAHEQMWIETTELLDQLVDVLGDKQVSPGDFAIILESGLAGFDLGLTPPAIDQVLAGSIDRTRCGNPRAVLLLGMNQSQFPRVQGERTILTNDDRSLLSRRAIELEPDTRRALLDEDFLAYLALSRATEELVLLRHSTDASGQPLQPSIYWTQVRRMFPGQPVRSHSPGAHRFATGRQVVGSILRWARQPEAEDHASFIGSLYQWLATRPTQSDALARQIKHSWRALQYDNKARLDPATVAKLYPGTLNTSVSRLESFASCPFKYFAGSVLRLRERDTDEISPLDLGNLYHRVLEGLASELVKSNSSWHDRKQAETEKRIAELAESVGKELRGSILLDTARGGFLLDASQQAIRVVARALEALSGKSRFRPAGAEVCFGDLPTDALPPLELKTPKGRTVLIRGKIDRVDIVDARSAAVVVDYKSGKRELDLQQVYHGLALQLLTYLVVLLEHGTKLCGKPINPAGAFYVPVRRGLESLDHPEEKCELVATRDHPKGLINHEFLPDLDTDYPGGPGFKSSLYDAWVTDEGKLYSRWLLDNDTVGSLLKFVRAELCRLVDQLVDGVIVVQPYLLKQKTPCPNCEFHSVCRFEPDVNEYLRIGSLTKDQIWAQVKEAKHGQ